MVLNRVALAGLVFGVAAVGACTTLRRVQPAEFIPKNSPDVVWVTHANKAVVPVAQPEIVGDTLRGMWQGTQRPVAIPLGEIQRVQAKVPDATKTAIVVTGGLVGFVAAVYTVWISKAGPRPDGVLCGSDPKSVPIQFC
jgi:hypothetical protein